MAEQQAGGGMVVTRQGTTLIRLLGDETKPYILEAIVLALAIDFALTLILLCCMVAWWMLALFLSVAGFLIGLVVLLFGRPSAKWMHYLFGGLWVIGALIPFIPLFQYGRFWMLLGQRLHYALVTGWQLIGEQLAVTLNLPWWVYPIAGVVLLVILIKGNWKAALITLALAVAVGTIALSDGDDWAAAWGYLRFLVVPYAWPLIGAALLLALVMCKEMLFPSLEWTLEPVRLEELREVGLIGLWAPGLAGKSVESPPPEPQRTVRAEHSDDTGNGVTERYADLPDSRRARDFYKLIHKGASFTLDTANRCKLGRKTYEDKIRQKFLERGWLEWKDEEHHDQGLELTQAGREMVGELALYDPRG